MERWITALFCTRTRVAWRAGSENREREELLLRQTDAHAAPPVARNESPPFDQLPRPCP